MSPFKPALISYLAHCSAHFAKALMNVFWYEITFIGSSSYKRPRTKMTVTVISRDAQPRDIISQNLAELYFLDVHLHYLGESDSLCSDFCIALDRV